MSMTDGILLVDDDPAIIQSLSSLFRFEGFRVWCASTGAQGLLLAREKRPGLVLLDVCLPDISGLDVCRQIKKDSTLQDVCVALFSGDATSTDHKVRGADVGADDYILKPVDAPELLARVQTLLRLRNTTAALRASEQYYRGLITILPDAVVLVTLQGQLLSVNSRAVVMLGYSAESELLGKSVFDLVAGEHRARLQAAIAAAVGAGIAPIAEYTFLKKTREGFPTELTAAALQNSLGHSLTVVAVIRDISERKRAQEQILLLADAIQSTQELVCITDSQNRFIFANRAFLNTYGYSEAEILGKTPDILLSPNNPPGILNEIIQATLRGGWSGELVDRRKDGTEFPVALNTSQIVNNEGQIMGLIGVARDISDVKKAAEALRLAEAQYRSIVEHATEGIYQATPDGRYLSANPALARMLGYDSPEELMSSVTDIGTQVYVRPERREEMKQLLEVHGSVKGVDTELVCKDGTRIWVRQNTRAVRDDQGRVLYHEATTQDITARKRSEEALEESRRLQKALFDNIPDPAWLKDAQGRFLACNEALAKFIGLPTEEIIGRTANDVNLREATQIGREDEEVKQLGKPIRFERQRTDSDGHRKWFETIKSPLFGEKDQVIGTVGIARDITLRKIFEGELRDFPARLLAVQEAERLRVSRELHDGVNQLLASVQMRIRHLHQTLSDKPAAREILGRCRELLSQALEENRRIAHDLRPSELDQLGLLDACRHLCKELGLRGKLKVRSHLARLEPRLSRKIELQLFRIVQEAFNNVEKHAKAKHVSLTLSLRGDFVILKIRDDGRGFDPINAQSPRARSRGIGLSNILERAASLNGHCEIESAPKSGTSITVRVPRA